MKELQRLAALVNLHQPTAALSGLIVIVSHIKLTLQRAQSERVQIRQQVTALNDLGIRSLFPEQGDRIEF